MKIVFIYYLLRKLLGRKDEVSKDEFLLGDEILSSKGSIKVRNILNDLTYMKFYTMNIIYILTQIFFLYTKKLKYLKRTFKPFFGYIITFEFVFLCCEFSQVILQSKSWCEMFILKLSVNTKIFTCQVAKSNFIAHAHF